MSELGEFYQTDVENNIKKIAVKKECNKRSKDKMKHAGCLAYFLKEQKKPRNCHDNSHELCHSVIKVNILK